MHERYKTASIAGCLGTWLLLACNCRCQDYVTIDAGAGGSMEYCGNVVPPNPFIVGTGILLIQV